MRKVEVAIAKQSNTKYEIRYTKYDKRTRGYTLAEAMLAVVIVGAAASGVLLPFASGAAVRAEGLHRTLAAKLAGDLIEQIANAPFDQIVPPDKIVVTYSESQGEIKDASGTTFTDPMYANFSRDAICQRVTVAQQPPREGQQCNFIRVTVRVCYQGKEIVSISRLVSK